MQTKKKFVITYAFDTPSYFSCTVEATSKADARRQANAALQAGVFNDVQADICWENASRNRVYLSAQQPEHVSDSLEALIDYEQKLQKAAAEIEAAKNKAIV